MDKPEMTEEDVFNNDTDPLEGIRLIRKEEGVADEDLAEIDAEIPASPAEPGEEKDEILDATPKKPDDEAGTDGKKPDDQQALDDGEQKPGDDDEKGGEKDGLQEEEKDDEAKAPVDDKDGDDKAGDEKPGEEPAGEKISFKANGQEFEFTQDEVMNQFGTVFAQAMNYTQKMQKIAPYRKMISALEQEGIKEDQLNVAIDALKGDKGALRALVESSKIDPYELTGEPEEGAQPYKANDYGKSDAEQSIEDVVSAISKDEEYPVTVDVIDNQWDQDSRTAFASNPQLIAGLHADVVSGMYYKVAAKAAAMKVLDGNTKSDIEYYMLAGKEVLASEKQTEQANAGQKQVDQLNNQAQAAEKDYDQASSEAQQKRSASSTPGRTDRKGVIDYLDDDDEKFDEWYNNLQANS